MRKKSTIINSFAGLVRQSVFLFTSFIVRYFLARYLLSDYLGLNGLFGNILGILSLVDMGLGTAIAFSLYKPIHDNNIKMINAIMQLYKKVYITIGCLIFILSLLLVPFMHLIVKDSSLDISYIKQLFIIYSFGTSLSYFFSYNRTLIFASQKNYIIQLVDGLIDIVFSVLQIISLVVFKSFLLYIVFKLTSTFVANVIITKFATSIFKFDNRYTELPKEYKKNLVKQVKALAITNLCGTAITSTDNLIISSLIGITDLARNSNYSLIITGIKSLSVSILSGATAAIGDLIVEGNNDKIYYYFEIYYFIHFLIASFCSVCFYFLFDPFIKLWVGEQYLFSNIIKTIIILNYYIIISMNAISVFQNLAGYYVLYKKVSIVSAFLNVIISIVLGLYFGVSGVFLGTTIAYIYSLIFCNKILHKKLFKRRTANYWYNQGKYFMLTIIIIVVVGFFDLIEINNLYLHIIYNLICIFIIYTVMIFIFFRKNDNLKYLINLILRRRV